MKAITIRQPWAGLIAAGVKDVENRPRNWGHRGRIAIHAGQTDDRGALRDSRVIRAAIQAPEGFPSSSHGRVLAVCTLADCHPATAGCCASEWANHDAGFHLVLTDVIRLPRPISALGQLGLWQLPTAVWVEVGRQLREIQAPVPPGVIACGPDGRQQQLPPEDAAVVEAFADSLTDREEW